MADRELCGAVRRWQIAVEAYQTEVVNRVFNISGLEFANVLADNSREIDPVITLGAGLDCPVCQRFNSHQSSNQRTHEDWNQPFVYC